jgi:TonB family protein
MTAPPVPETLQLEPKIAAGTQLHDAPKLLVEWSSPWQEFVTSIRPALARSRSRLAGEAPYGIFPYRGMIPCLLAEAFLIFAAIVVRVKIERLRPYVAPRFSSRDVIYYSGDELPRTEDLGGAQSGANGRAGGNEAHHRTQTIRIARGSLTPQVVDAPNLKLPSSRDAVANLLAINPNVGPPPAEGLRSTRKNLTLSTPVVAPAPNVIHDYTRNGIQLEAVIAPSPSAPRDPFRAAPNLSAEVVPPAPKVSDDHALVAPALGSPIIPPAPRISSDHMRGEPSLHASVVAPAPNVTSGSSRSAPALASNVIPPAPGSVSREVSSTAVTTANVNVVPPPVSAPERATGRNSKLSLPSPSVIAPPPSADISQDTRRLASGSAPDPTKTVVPPPPSQAGSGSYMSSLIGKIFGSSEVVPPPPSVNSSGAGSPSPALAANVVPPPPAVDTNGGNPRGNRRGTGASLGSNVIAPPPSAGVSGGNGNIPASASKAPALGMPSVVPPPPSVAGEGGGSGTTGGGKGASGGTLLANNVVPPPPSVGGGASATGSGLGRKGPGFGSSIEVGSVLAPPHAGGSGNNAGVVASGQPGPKVGLPTNGGKGSIALSPSGGDKPGLGGSGNGASIGQGSGPGSGTDGDGAGAGKHGPGRGSELLARGGISPTSGSGGAGTATSGTPAVPGVSVSGGSTIVTLPSFGSDPSANDPRTPGRSPTQRRDELNVTVVATATSGGAFEPYKNLLHGQTYTTYLTTSAGTVVMEFADTANTTGTANVTAPQGIRTSLPSNLPHARMVVACTLDASGNVRSVRVLEPGPPAMTRSVVLALNSWKFQPAMRGDQPITVSAIIGFGIDTNDRF